MFTRYSNIEVPKNYSGNRFKNGLYEDTTMKIHESEILNEIKTSVSPTYNDWIYANQNSSSSQTTDELFEKNLDLKNEAEDGKENDLFNVDEEKLPKHTQRDNSNDTPSRVSTNSTENHLSKLFDYLKNIKTDDLLIISLIIFLGSDKNTTNNEIIILLALLLTL